MHPLIFGAICSFALLCIAIVKTSLRFAGDELNGINQENYNKSFIRAYLYGLMTKKYRVMAKNYRSLPDFNSNFDTAKNLCQNQKLTEIADHFQF